VIDLREAALPEYRENLEAVIEDVADSVLNSLGASRGSYLGRVGFRQRSVAA
jgi:hypothetical protein